MLAPSCTWKVMSNYLLPFLKEKLRANKQYHPELSKLTVVVPSYCRQDFVVRQAAYWHGCGASIIVIDGSPEPLSGELQHILSDLGDISYVHSTTVIVERLKYAATLINTPYTVMCGDDEFLLHSGLCSAVRYLERDYDVVACAGQSLRYTVSKDGSQIFYGAGYDTYDYEVRQSTAADRLKAALNNYNAATCYAVTRSSVWRKSWGDLQVCSSGFAVELEHAFTTYIWGKLGSVNDVYWMRSNENPPAVTADYSRIPIENWWTAHEYEAEKFNFVTKLGIELVESQNCDLPFAESVVTNAFELYLREKPSPSTPRLHHKMRQFVISLLEMLMPDNGLIRLKLLWRKAGIFDHGMHELGSLKDLGAREVPTPLTVHEQLISELSSMECLIADFYKARGG